MTIENKIIVSGLIPTTVVGILFALGSAIFTDAQAGYSALGGMVLTLVFFIFGQYIIGKVLLTKPEIGLGVAMIVYLTQLIVLLVLIKLLRDAPWLDGKSFGIAILTSTLSWTAGSVWVMAKHKNVVIEPISPQALKLSKDD
jgi:ATP synthase protein I